MFEQEARASHQDDRDEEMRAPLALFLHDRHPRTAD